MFDLGGPKKNNHRFLKMDFHLASFGSILN